MTDLADGPALKVAHWRRYGQHRIYVNTDDGQRVGWHDCHTGERTLELDELRASFDRALASELGESPPDTPQAPPAPVDDVVNQAVVFDQQAASLPPIPPPPPSPTAVEPSWTDLARNRPGEGVAAEAKRAFAEAPVKSVAARLLGVHTQERAWRVGAKGESLVAKQLAKLESTWRTLHSVPVGSRGSDIDHVTIGPGGIYTINAKHHPNKDVWVHRDTFVVDGFRQRYIRNARYEADRTQRLLTEALGFDVTVVGIVAVVNAAKFVVKEQPQDGRVVVLARRHLPKWLGNRDAVLGAHQLEEVFDAARRSTTWT